MGNNQKKGSGNVGSAYSSHRFSRFLASASSKPLPKLSTFSGFVFGKNRKPIKLPKPEKEPKPLRGKVNPQDYEIVAVDKFSLQNINDEPIPTLKLLLPGIFYHGYRIVSLKSYFDDKAIYIVLNEINKKQLLYQYKFYSTSQVNSKCKTLSFLSQIGLDSFHGYYDFFVDFEEIEFHSFFYLNVVLDPHRSISLSEIMANLHRKSKNHIDEFFIWEIMSNILNSLNMAYQKGVFLENLSLEKTLLNLPKKKKNEGKPFMLANLIKILGKAVQKNNEILVFNRVSDSRKKHKERIFSKVYLRKMINSKPFYFDFMCFQLSEAQNSLQRNESKFYQTIVQFFTILLGSLCKMPEWEFITKGISYIEANIEKLEYSIHLKTLLKKACLCRQNLPLSLLHLKELHNYKFGKFRSMASSEKSLSKEKETQDLINQKFRAQNLFLYRFHQDHLILMSIDPAMLKTPRIVNINMKGVKPSEIRDNSIKCCCWDMKNQFFVIFEKTKAKNYIEKVFVFSLDIDDIRSKMEENETSRYDDLSKNSNFIMKEFVSLNANFIAIDIFFEYPAILKIAGFESLKNRIQFFAYQSESKSQTLIKEVVMESKHFKIIDFWLNDQEIWFWKRKKMSNFEKDYFEIHNIAKNTVTNLEIDRKTYEKIEPEGIIRNLLFYSRPLVFRELEKIIVLITLGEKKVMIYGNMTDLSDSLILNSGEKATYFPSIDSVSNFLVLNQRQLYMISNQEGDLSFDFYELDENLLRFYFENTMKIEFSKTENMPEFDQLRQKFNFSKYKVLKLGELSQVLEVFEEEKGRDLLVFKRSFYLGLDKFNPSVQFFRLEDAKFFYDLIFDSKVRKSVYLPEDFFFSPNVTAQTFELWLFMEKNEGNLLDFLKGYKHSHTYDSLRLFRSILKKILRIKEIELTLRKNFTLEDIWIVVSKKGKKKLKFNILSSKETNDLSSTFLDFKTFCSSKKEDHHSVSSDFLSQIPNEKPEKFGYLLFFIVFPRFLSHLDLNSESIRIFLEKLMSSVQKKYETEVLELIQRLILGKIVDLEGILPEISQILKIRVYNREELPLIKLKGIQPELQTSNRQILFFLLKGCPFLLKFNFFSHQIRKSRLFLSSSQRFDPGTVSAFCFSPERCIIFGISAFLNSGQLFFFGINAEEEKDQYYVSPLPDNLESKYQNIRDFEPGTMTFFRDCVYQIGGIVKLYQQIQGSNECFLYNPLSNKWSSLNPLNFPRTRPGFVATSSYLYIFGGDDPDDSAGKSLKICIERFDPDTGFWEALFLRDISRSAFSSFYNDTKFITQFQSEDRFIMINLQRNKCLLINLGEENRLWESEIGEPMALAKFLEEKRLERGVDEWIHQGFLLGNRSGSLCFSEGGDLFVLRLRQDEEKSRVYWDQEILSWKVLL